MISAWGRALVRGETRLEPPILVGVGGFAGATVRHAVTVSVPPGVVESLPMVAGALPPAVLGTLAVNVLGSFALGVLLYAVYLTGALSPGTRLLVGTGFLSSFTTYSTFAHQTVSLSPGVAALNVAGNYGLCLLAVVLGHVVARWFS